MANSTSVSPTKAATLEPRRRAPVMPTAYANAPARTLSPSTGHDPRELGAGQLDVVGGGVHRHHAGEAGQAQRTRTDDHPAGGHGERREPAEVAGGQHEVGGQAHGSGQAPRDSSGVDVGAAHHVEHEHEASDGQHDPGDRPPPGSLPVTHPQPPDHEDEAEVLEEQRHADREGLDGVEVEELAPGHGQHAVDARSGARGGPGGAIARGAT